MTDTAIMTPWRILFRGDARFVLVVATFISLLLIGADLIALPVGGVTIRLNFIPLLGGVFALWLNKTLPMALERGLLCCFLVMTLAAIGSCFQSYDPAKSMAYTMWVIFTYFVIITLFYNYACRVSVRTVFRMWRAIYRIHAVGALTELCVRLAIGNLDRPHLWFYETSYLAIFMTGYFASALYLFTDVSRNRYALDLGLATLTLMALASATALAGLLLSVMAVILVARRRLLLIVASLIFGVSTAAAAYVWFSETAYYRLVFGFVLRQDFSVLDLIMRAGNRYPRFLIGWEAFLSHPWFGIGIGADESYMLATPVSPTTWQYVNRFSDVDQVGYPFTNIIIEVLASMGIAGFLPFAASIIYALYRAIRLPGGRSEEAYMTRAVFLAFFAIFLVLQVEASFLRYYLWSTLGLALGMADRHSRVTLTN